MNPSVSIIIPTYNHLEDCLKPCLESVIQNTDMDQCEIVVVANGCTDGTEDYVMDLNHPSIRLVRTDLPLGYTKATNLGIQNSYGEFVLVFNNDNVILPFWAKNQWIDAMRDPFLHNPKMGITGPSILFDGNSKSHFVIFFCAMTKREYFIKYGLLDESFSPGGGEDTEFAIRMQNLGYEICNVNGNGEAVIGAQSCFHWSYYSYFPIYHKAEQTVFGQTYFNWQEVYDRNSEALAKRFRKPIKYSIIVPNANEVSSLEKCLKSIWKYTDYSELEIILVFAKDNQAVADFYELIKRHAPYVSVVTDSQLQYSKAVEQGINKASGEYVIIVSSGLELQPQPKSLWIQRFLMPFADSENAISAVAADAVSCSTWCMMMKKNIFVASGFNFSNMIHRFLRNKYITMGNDFPVICNFATIDSFGDF